MSTASSHIWLWPEKGEHREDTLRAWTATSTVSLSFSIPKDLPEALIMGTVGMPLESALPSDFVGWLKQQLTDDQLTHLILSTKLASEWHTCPYEWLTLNGHPLCQRLQVWRHAQHTPEPLLPIPQPACSVMLNLWPDATLFRKSGQDCWDLICFEGQQDVASYLRQTPDLRHHAALCIISHGSEDGEALPFRLTDRSLWALPEDVQLPPLVILLACGDHTGNLLDYGKTLLDRGAKTVLAAIGQLDAKAMAEHFPALLKAWQAGVSIGDALLDWQKDLQQYTRGRLCLLGNGALRVGETTVDEWPVECLSIAARDGNDPALRTLLSRLTLHSFLKKGHLGETTGQLRDLLQIPEIGEPGKNLSLLSRLLSIVVDTLPSLTQVWVVPLMSHLAEQHDHARLNDRKKRLIILSQQYPASDVLYYDWAKAEYRKGLYARAARVAVDGLCCTAENGLPAIRLLGQLTNTLDDLNIPIAAKACLEQRSEKLDRLDDRFHKFKEDEKFKDRDIRGRLLLRQGNYEVGLLELERKRNDEPAGERELAWVLYTAALVGPFDDDTAYSAECCQLLEQHSVASDGNSDTLYLLRALSAWVWQRADQQALATLESWVPELCARLKRHQDTGPVGFSLCYLHLAGFSTVLDLPPFGVIAVALDDDRYYLELAIFAALLGETVANRRVWLDKYHKERRAATASLANLPAWVHFPNDLCSEHMLNTQEVKEKTLLLEETSVRLCNLVEAHVLPW